MDLIREIACLANEIWLYVGKTSICMEENG